MIEQFAKSDNLQCLINMNRYLEPFPEPFRMQRSVVFRVTYSAFVDYIQGLKSCDGIILPCEVNTLKGLASLESTQLHNFFLRSLSYAILKELHFAEKHDAVATVILPYAEVNSVQFTTLVTSYDISRHLFESVEAEVRIALRNLGFELPDKISVVNQDMYKIAIMLYRFSLLMEPKELNIIYDCRVS